MHISGGGGNKSKQGFREPSRSYFWRQLQPTAPCYPNPGGTLLFTRIIWSWSHVMPPPLITPQTYHRRNQTLLFIPPASLPLYMLFALSWSPALPCSWLAAFLLQDSVDITSIRSPSWMSTHQPSSWVAGTYCLDSSQTSVLPCHGFYSLCCN